MATFPASIVTPERNLLETEVSEVVMRTDGGEAAFLAGHTPLVGAVVPGLVRFVAEDGTEQRAAVHGGFVQVDGSSVVVLAPVAELAEEIDVARAQQALETADARLAELAAAGRSNVETDGGTDRDVADATAARRRAEVRLEVAGA